MSSTLGTGTLEVSAGAYLGTGSCKPPPRPPPHPQATKSYVAKGNLRCRRKTSAEADCGLPSGGADYACTICLTHDATVAACIDRGVANGLTRGSAMFCTVATSRGVLHPLITANSPKWPRISIVHGTLSFLKRIGF